MQKVFQKTALVALVAAIIMCLGMLMATMAWADATSTQNEPAATTATANNQDNSNATESTSSDGINLLNSLMNTSGSQSSDTQTVETQTTDSQTDNTIPPLPAEVTEIIENQDAQVQVEAVQTEDTAGNVFVSGGALDKTLVNDVKTGDFADIYLFGGDLMVEDATIGGDVIAAIDRMDVQKTTVGGSVRAAGNTITIDEVTAKGNATIAGNSVVLGGLAKFNAVYIAARDVSFNGEAKAFSAAGETVVMNGKVDGDVRIFANKVVIGRNAVVTGTMYISSPTIPEVPETAQISAMEFYETGSVDVNENIKLSWAPTIPDFTDTNYWIQVGIVALYCLVIAILLALFLRGAVENSARIARERTGALIISGIVGTILSPFAVILLCILIITIPLGLSLLFLLFIVTLLCVPFAAASIGKAIFKKWHRIPAAILFSLLFGASMLIPYAGPIVFIACFMYMLGYLIQLMYLGMRGRTAPRSLFSADDDSIDEDVPVNPAPAMPPASSAQMPAYGQGFQQGQTFAPRPAYAPAPVSAQQSFAQQGYTPTFAQSQAQPQAQPQVQQQYAAQQTFQQPAAQQQPSYSAQRPAQNTAFAQAMNASQTYPAPQQQAQQNNAAPRQGGEVSPVLQTAYNLASYEQSAQYPSNQAIGAHAAPASSALDLDEADHSSYIERNLASDATQNSAQNAPKPLSSEFLFDASNLPELPREK